MDLKIDRNVVAKTDEEKSVVSHYRATLWGQQTALEREKEREKARSRQQLAEAEFGLSYSEDEMSNRVRKSIRIKLSKQRVANWSSVEGYTQLIPEAALIKLAVAQRSGFFDIFHIVEPRYSHLPAVSDPWLVGSIAGTARHIVIAYWD